MTAAPSPKRASVPVHTPPSPAPWPIQAPTVAKPNRWFVPVAWILIGLVVLAAVDVGTDPGARGAVFLFVLLSSVAVFIDGKSLRLETLGLAGLKVSDTERMSPGLWAVGVAILWPVFLPWYMAIRKKLAQFVASASQVGQFPSKAAMKLAMKQVPQIPAGSAILGAPAAAPAYAAPHGPQAPPGFATPSASPAASPGWIPLDAPMAAAPPPTPPAPKRWWRTRKAKFIAWGIVALFAIGIYAANIQRESFDAVQTELNKVNTNLQLAGNAFEREDWSHAEEKAQAADDAIATTYATFNAHQSSLSTADREVFVDSLVLYRDLTRATLDMARTLRRTMEVTSLVENATGEEVFGYLPEYEMLARELDRSATAWEGLASSIEHLLVDKPRSAQFLSLEISTAGQYRDGAKTFRESAKAFRDLVAEAAAQNNYKPVDDRILPTSRRPVPGPQPSPSSSTVPVPTPAHADYFTPTVRALFDKFDQDQSGSIDLGEGEAFYSWVEKNIKYRYDDENQKNPQPGYPVGDGRPGPDYSQRPQETIDEGYGDCEDQNGLEVAFYEYWGVTAYEAYVNAKAETHLDHAIALVFVGPDDSAARSVIGRLDVFNFAADNQWHIPAGAYMIVDNAYSSTYGYISSGIPPGKFQIFEVHSLGETFTVPVQ